MPCEPGVPLTIVIDPTAKDVVEDVAGSVEEKDRCLSCPDVERSQGLVWLPVEMVGEAGYPSSFLRWWWGALCIWTRRRSLSAQAGSMLTCSVMSGCRWSSQGWVSGRTGWHTRATGSHCCGLRTRGKKGRLDTAKLQPGTWAGRRRWHQSYMSWPRALPRDTTAEAPMLIVFAIVHVKLNCTNFEFREFDRNW